MLVLENRSIKEATTIKSVSTEFTGNYYLTFTTYNDKIEFVGKRGKSGNSIPVVLEKSEPPILVQSEHSILV